MAPRVPVCIETLNIPKPANVFAYENLSQKIDRYPTSILNKITIGQYSHRSEVLANKFCREKYSSEWF